MRDGPAERRLCRRLGIEMDKLPVLGCLRKGVDPRLIDQKPTGEAHLFANPPADFVESRDRHQKGRGAVGWLDARTSWSLCVASVSISERRIPPRLAASRSLSRVES